jgi:hypothetical protein
MRGRGRLDAMKDDFYDGVWDGAFFAYRLHGDSHYATWIYSANFSPWRSCVQALFLLHSA